MPSRQPPAPGSSLPQQQAPRAQAPAAVVTGLVRDAGGRPLAGATVRAAALGAGTEAAVARTGRDGRYRLMLAPGAYELRTRALGYLERTARVTVGADGATAEAPELALPASPAALAPVAVVGQRASERTATRSPAPVDVFTAAELAATGRVELAQQLQAVAPSVNFPRAAWADGGDAPLTLRGLGGDQVLVLVNGKRRHPGALLNVNGTLGRGQATVDLNAIPAALVERVEILRDGAAAQYGSDAVAGVINVVLKGADAPPVVTLQTGQTAEGDGRLLLASAAARLVGRGGAFLQVGVEGRDRGATDRSLDDRRQLYFTGDPREATADRRTHRHGELAARQLAVFANGAAPVGPPALGAELFGFAGVGRRRTEGSGFFRRPSDDRNVRALWPDGFRPLARGSSADASGSVGVRGTVGGWRTELSQTLGHNAYTLRVANSVNASLGAASPRDFRSGELRFTQATSNLDLFRAVTLPAVDVPLRLAAGAEYRHERFGVDAGDPASWANGGQPVLDRDGRPRMVTPPGASAQVPLPAAPFAQAYPGFAPADARRVGRSNAAAYVDAEADLARWLLVGGAARYERYDDAGDGTTGRVTARVAPVRQAAVRGAYATGFRAPSLMQSWFTATGTNFVNGIPYDVRTFAVADPAARLLGARPLRPEGSTSRSIGLVLTPAPDRAPSLAVTADYYDVRITDRVVLSENLTQPAVAAFLAANGVAGVTGARFFTNAIDTKTTGLDVVAAGRMPLGADAALRLTGGFNRSATAITRLAQVTPPALAALNEALFGRVERGRVTLLQPKDNYVLAAAYEGRRVTLDVRGQRVGAFTVLQGNPAFDQRYDPRWLADISLGVGLGPAGRLTVGADNVADVYPERNAFGDATVGGNSNSGMFPYPTASPIGFAGRFVYARLTRPF